MAILGTTSRVFYEGIKWLPARASESRAPLFLLSRSLPSADLLALFASGRIAGVLGLSLPALRRFNDAEQRSCVGNSGEQEKPSEKTEMLLDLVVVVSVFYLTAIASRRNIFPAAFDLSSRPGSARRRRRSRERERERCRRRRKAGAI